MSSVTNAVQKSITNLKGFTIMKKLLSIFTIVAFLACGSLAMAGGWNSSNYEAASGSGFASDPDYASDFTWNDGAMAGANGGGGFAVTAESWGKHFAQAFVYGTAVGEADTYACAADWGYTSFATAGSQVQGSAFAMGETFGGFWNVKSDIYGSTFFEGMVDQNTYVQETGYNNGQGIEAGQYSFAHGINGENFSDNTTFLGANYEDGYGQGFIKTMGESTVTIDPNGDYRSMSGSVENCSVFDTSYRNDGAVMLGNGFVQGGIANGYGAFASGASHFSYAGDYTTGAKGQANLNANIQKTSNSTTVTVSAGASSTTLQGCYSGCGDKR
jgi:hypothetical protein